MIPEVPGFAFLERLSRPGRNSEVWLAQTATGAEVALKVILGGPPHLVARLEAEGRWLRRLGGKHHLVACHAVIANPPGLVLELAGRETLLELLYLNGPDRAPTPLQPDTALRVTLEAADAVDWLHQNGVIHRDVKPSNVVLAANGTVRLVDLSVAAPNDPSSRPVDGWIDEEIGSVGYVAPELLRDPKTAAAPVDVYGLAATLYEALSGHLPFDFHQDETETDLRRRIAAGELPVPLVARIRAPAALGELIARALSPDAADRFQSVGAFVEALSPFA